MTASGDDPSILDSRGAHLRFDLRKQHEGDAAALALIEEACRIVDRLDELDRILSRPPTSWLDALDTDSDGTPIKLIINAPLAEARQQAMALKQIFTELRQMRAQAHADPDEGGGEEDELAARRAARIANTAGR